MGREYFSKTNKTREYYNPLAGLTMQRIVALRQEGIRGEYVDLQWLYRSMLGSYDILLSLRSRREAALLKLDWNIKQSANVESSGRKQLGKDQAAVLEDAYNRLDNLREAISFLALAEFVGYSHLSKHRNTNGETIHLEPLDQWCWVRDGMRGEWLWNPESEKINAGRLKERPNSHINPADFIIREVDNPICNFALANFVRENIGQKDWAHFVEIYGLPGVFVIGPANVAADKEAAFQTAAEDAAEGGSGYLPNGSDVKNMTTPYGRSPFKEYLEDLRAQLVRVGTGGKLTMMNDAAGLGGANAKAHENAFEDIADAEAQKINEVMQRDFDKEILEQNFPGQPVMAYFELARSKQDNPNEIFTQLEMLARSGYRVDIEQVSEKTGFKIVNSKLDEQSKVVLQNAMTMGNKREQAETQCMRKIFHEYLEWTKEKEMPQ